MVAKKVLDRDGRYKVLVCSLFEGHSSFNVRVLLSDFFLGLPANSSMRPQEDVLRWTVFEAAPHANETSCASDCWYRSDCLAHFLGHGGCFLAVNNHTHEESRDLDESVIGSAAAGNRHFSGTLTGCKLEEDKLEEAWPLVEMGLIGRDHLENRSRFSSFKPDGKYI